MNTYFVLEDVELEEEFPQNESRLRAMRRRDCADTVGKRYGSFPHNHAAEIAHRKHVAKRRTNNMGIRGKRLDLKARYHVKHDEEDFEMAYYDMWFAIEEEEREKCIKYLKDDLEDKTRRLYFAERAYFEELAKVCRIKEEDKKEAQEQLDHLERWVSYLRREVEHVQRCLREEMCEDQRCNLEGMQVSML